MRDGRIIEVSVTGSPVDTGLPAAVVYSGLCGALPLDTLETLRIGDARTEDVGLRLRHVVPAGQGWS